MCHYSVRIIMFSFMLIYATYCTITSSILDVNSLEKRAMNTAHSPYFSPKTK